MNTYLFTIALTFDRFVGAFIPGAYPNESISGRAFREDWKFQIVINKIFFDDKHCENSYWAEVNDRYDPPLKGI